MDLRPKHQGGRCRRDSGHSKDASSGGVPDEEDRSADRRAEHAEYASGGHAQRQHPTHRLSVIV